MDTMSFIFRAYHAMARQRPMSTKKGVPTAATYVFVNRIRNVGGSLFFFFLLSFAWLRSYCLRGINKPQKATRLLS